MPITHTPTAAELMVAVQRLKAGLTTFCTGGHMEPDHYQELRTLLRSSTQLRGRLPEFVATCHTTEEFWSFIKPRIPTYQARREYLAAQFNPVLDFLETVKVERATDVELVASIRAADPLSHEFIEQQLSKCDSKLDAGDFDGAITNARALLEAALLEMERALSAEKPASDGNLLKQYKRVQRLLNLDPAEPDLGTALTQILSGMSSVVAGLAGLRNVMSDAHARTYRPQEHHARLAVNAAKTIADFLFQTYEYQLSKGRVTPVGGAPPSS